VADDFSERYGDLINGSYDCVDRVVLNAWCPMGVNPGGLRTWWRGCTAAMISWIART
jgi:hypothetical protein